MAERREGLKIIGAIGVTCAFPFAADELYGQHADAPHQHHTPGKQAPTGPIRFFTAAELAIAGAAAEQIIPETDTPGAIKAGVPGYMDLVLFNNKGQQKLIRDGLKWLDDEARQRHKQGFAALTAAQQLAILKPLCDACDRGAAQTPPERFFQAFKNLTCDGYYTSRPGMVDELGFTGPAVLAEYQRCEIPEH